MIEIVRATHSFKEGDNPVAAHRHPNGGGWVADTASVDESVYIEAGSCVFGIARVVGSVRLTGESSIYDCAWVWGDDVRIHGQSQVFDNALVSGSARLVHGAKVFGEAWVCDRAQVLSGARVFGQGYVGGEAKVERGAEVYDEAMIYGKAKLIEVALCGTDRLHGSAIRARI